MLVLLSFLSLFLFNGPLGVYLSLATVGAALIWHVIWMRSLRRRMLQADLLCLWAIEEGKPEEVEEALRHLRRTAWTRFFLGGATQGLLLARLRAFELALLRNDPRTHARWRRMLRRAKSQTYLRRVLLSRARFSHQNLAGDLAAGEAAIRRGQFRDPEESRNAHGLFLLILARDAISQGRVEEAKPFLTQFEDEGRWMERALLLGALQQDPELCRIACNGAAMEKFLGMDDFRESRLALQERSLLTQRQKDWLETAENVLRARARRFFLTVEPMCSMP